LLRCRKAFLTFRMELESGKSGGNVVVALRGELDLTDAAT
jgi:hypothetical protein